MSSMSTKSGLAPTKSTLFEVAEKHVTSKADYDLAISGAKKGIAIYRTWLGLMANDMERMR